MNANNAQLAGALVGLGATITEAMDTIEGFVPCGHPAAVVIDNLVALNRDLSADELAERVQTVSDFIQHVSENRGVSAHAIADVSALGNSKGMLFAALEDVAAAVSPKGNLHQNVNEWLYRSLDALERDSHEFAEERLAELPSIQAAIELL